MLSHCVNGNIDLETRGRVGKHRPDIVFEEIPNPVEFHDVSGLGA